MFPWISILIFLWATCSLYWHFWLWPWQLQAVGNRNDIKETFNNLSTYILYIWYYRKKMLITTDEMNKWKWIFLLQHFRSISILLYKSNTKIINVSSVALWLIINICDWDGQVARSLSPYSKGCGFESTSRPANKAWRDSFLVLYKSKQKGIRSQGTRYAKDRVMLLE